MEDRHFSSMSPTNTRQNAGKNMKQHRTAILMGLLLVILGFYLYLQYPTTNQVEPPLEGTNEIKNIKIVKHDDNTHWVTVEYFYTGSPAGSAISIVPTNPGEKVFYGNRYLAKRGLNTLTAKIERSYRLLGEKPYTNSLIVGIAHIGKLVTGITEDYKIEWPSLTEAMASERRTKQSVEELYHESVNLIDNSRSETAKPLLEEIILREPAYAPAYIEMARVAMKTNWSPEGIAQAEKYLNSALNIDPASANARVLLGYVYTHQQRFSEAEAQFIKANEIGTKNLWLWANWGELLVAQGDVTGAIAKYLKALDGERPFNTYDRARLDAYRNALSLLEVIGDKEKQNELYSRRANEFTVNSCYLAQHAHFLIQTYGDYAEGEKKAQLAIKKGCQQRFAKQTLGLSSYYKWLQSKTENEAYKMFAQAQVFYPIGPALYYDLVKSETGLGILKTLIEQVDVDINIQNEEQQPVLALALLKKDTESALKLIQLGASVDSSMGTEKFPISLIPVTTGDIKSVEMLRKHGVEYSEVQFKNMTAVQFSEAFGSPHITKALAAGTRL